MGNELNVTWAKKIVQTICKSKHCKGIAYCKVIIAMTDAVRGTRSSIAPKPTAPPLGAYSAMCGLKRARSLLTEVGAAVLYARV